MLEAVQFGLPGVAVAFILIVTIMECFDIQWIYAVGMVINVVLRWGYAGMQMESNWVLGLSQVLVSANALARCLFAFAENRPGGTACGQPKTVLWDLVLVHSAVLCATSMMCHGEMLNLCTALLEHSDATVRCHGLTSLEHSLWSNQKATALFM
ncbi:hypothetical protein Nepgr_021429 [Nepenthes gracilis]|uniref:Uncharacterized protein n=1 Tax=Nepenthes gracilis TaxID=150966 RepID=A0AAD3XW30_NEPGR|nr:hypothetical protein Nepgr_021429 [Nepenthes gracilis]